MKKKITALALTALLFALCSSAQAQQPTKIARIGFLSGSGHPKSPGLQVEAFQQGLRNLGYIEGKNVLLEYRFIEGMEDRISGLIAELVKLKVDVLVVVTTQGIRAAKEATKTIPIVIVTTQDPVAMGIVDSLARPGGNITGLALLTRDLSAKRLELLTEALQKTAGGIPLGLGRPWAEDCF
jgi:putative tryptophan/tyrosine transport system substrate-binding protein